VVRIREVKKEIFPSLLNLFFFPLDSKVFEYEYKVLSSHFTDFWDKRTIELY
jgi:hypothetical protein